MRKTRWSGCPFDDSHSAHSTGHNSSQMPIGLSSRMSRPYAPIFAAAFGTISPKNDGDAMTDPAHAIAKGVGTRSHQLLPKPQAPSPSSDFAKSLSRPRPSSQQRRYVRLILAQHQFRRGLNLRQQVGVADQVRDAHLHE